MKKPTEIMLIEDHPEYREVIGLALADEADMNLTGRFGSAEVAIRSLQDKSTRTEPDIILLDINLPGMKGIEAIPRLKNLSPKSRIIMLTQSNMEADVVEAIQNGAAGYLLKSSSIEQITGGIRMTMANGATLDPSVAKYILHALGMQSSLTTLQTDLTSREMETLVLLSEGLVKKEIAQKLGISTHTVGEYVKNIYSKLEVQNAPAAVHKAHKLGLFDD